MEDSLIYVYTYSVQLMTLLLELIFYGIFNKSFRYRIAVLIDPRDQSNRGQQGDGIQVNTEGVLRDKAFSDWFSLSHLPKMLLESPPPPGRRLHPFPTTVPPISISSSNNSSPQPTDEKGELAVTPLVMLEAFLTSPVPVQPPSSAGCRVIALLLCRVVERDGLGDWKVSFIDRAIPSASMSPLPLRPFSSIGAAAAVAASPSWTEREAIAADGSFHVSVAADLRDQNS